MPILFNNILSILIYGISIIVIISSSKHLLLLRIHVHLLLRQHLHVLLPRYYLVYQKHLHVVALLQPQNPLYLLQLVPAFVLLIGQRFPLSPTSQHTLRSAMTQFRRLIHK